jgi:hypothetical protein
MATIAYEKLTCDILCGRISYQFDDPTQSQSIYPRLKRDNSELYYVSKCGISEVFDYTAKFDEKIQVATDVLNQTIINLQSIIKKIKEITVILESMINCMSAVKNLLFFLAKIKIFDTSNVEYVNKSDDPVYLAGEAIDKFEKIFPKRSDDKIKFVFEMIMNVFELMADAFRVVIW